MAVREFLDWVEVRKTYRECGQHPFMRGLGPGVREESRLCSSMVTGTPSPFSTLEACSDSHGVPIMHWNCEPDTPFLP